MEKIAAIDIGSNAIRFTTADLISQNELLLGEKVRIPIRLGSQAFSADQKFSANFIDHAKETFIEIKKTLDNLGIKRCRTVATSAVRDAKNSLEFINEIHKSSGIKINTISGDTEAKLILKAIEHTTSFNQDFNYLLFDLGGGSLELSYIKNGKIKDSKSFDLGTVRMLEYLKTHRTQKEIDNWITPKLEMIQDFISTQSKNSQTLMNIIGTGGNFRRILKLNSLITQKETKSLSIFELYEIQSTLQNTSFIERVKDFDLRPDRADVILPALRVIISVLEGLPINKIYAPKVGLSQGVLIDMSDGIIEEDQLF